MKLRLLLTILLCACGASPKSSRQSGRDSTADAGFAGPENLVFDTTANVLLIANINGDPMQKDGNGFISRVGLDGKFLDLKWINGSHQQTPLDAPKGMTLHGDTLFVDDIDQIRMFDRNNGASLGSIAVPGSKMLNDIVVDANGLLYTSDTDGNTIYVRSGSVVTAFARGDDLEKPDGLELNGSDLLVAPLGGNEVYRAGAGQKRAPWVTLATGKLDGLHKLTDGSYLVTSWQGKKVYHIAADRSVTDIADDIESPAGLAFDPHSNTVFITSLNTNRLYRVSLDATKPKPQ